MLQEIFQSITFGKPQSFGSAAAIPLSTFPRLHSLAYLTLSEAMDLTLLRIEEVTDSGLVPEIKVISTADIPILLVSGEEVSGAKQNRILNTTILIPASATMSIPVSCTERGRWCYVSPDFKDSGNISSSKVRMAASESVRHSLDYGRGHRSDQNMIWDKIEELHHKSNSDHTSYTRAMDDAFSARQIDLDKALRQFRLIPGQTGILFFHSGEAAGLDLLSSPAAYARLHDKLVKSYAIEALQLKKGKDDPDSLKDKAIQFLNDAAKGEVSVFKSPGLGHDHRITSPSIHGSMLEYNEEAIHICCFRIEKEEERMAGFNTRRKL